jgi:hypothetical protein
MVYMLTIDVVPPEGGRVAVTHTFYGKTEKEAREAFAAHAAGCEFLTPAIAEDRVEEELDTIEDGEWPSYENVDDDAPPDDEEEDEEDDADEDDEEE